MAVLPTWLQPASYFGLNDFWRRESLPQGGIDLGNGRVLGAEDVLEGHFRRMSAHRQPSSRQVAVQVGDNLMVAITVLAPDLAPLTEIAEQVFDAPVRIGYPERDRFGGLVEDIQSPAWTAAAGLALLAFRAQAAEIRTGVSRRGSTGKLTHFVSRFRNRFGSIF